MIFPTSWAGLQPEILEAGHGITVAREGFPVVTPGSETAPPLWGDCRGRNEAAAGTGTPAGGWVLYRGWRYTPGAHVGVAELVDALG